MNQISSPWALVRHMWSRNFQQNPVGTVIGSLLAIGGVGLLLFFGFFVVIAVFVMGGLLMLANALFGGPKRQTAQPPRENPFEQGDTKPQNNDALEGEYTVVSDDENGRSKD